ncbi:MAG TPA: hypothetical protein VJQ81_20120 [Reyranella sp.]|nr:hypothetical protein [Reyranella sp.]
MPTKQGRARPRTAHGGYGSDMPADTAITRNRSAKPPRNRNRVVSAKPTPVARQRRSR